jgi:nucleotide-binding universal stress UspA family protein
MFTRVLAGFDGYDGGRDAIVLADRLRPEHLTVLMAYGTQTVVAPIAAIAYWDECRDDAKRRVAAACRELGVTAEERVVADMSPARALHDHAAEHHADLLVVGSTHRGAVGRLLVGDVGAAVLRDAPCPVAIVPKRLRDTRWAPRRIAVAYDGGDGSPEVLRAGAELAARHGGTLVVCTVWDTPLVDAAAYPEDVLRIGAESEQRARAVLDGAVVDAGVATERRLLRGHAGRALAEVTHEVDLMVVGSRGWGSPGRLILGGTSHRLAHRAACPLIVLPRPTVAARAPGAPRAGARTTAP